jgi:hypothetical protein
MVLIKWDRSSIILAHKIPVLSKFSVLPFQTSYFSVNHQNNSEMIAHIIKWDKINIQPVKDTLLVELRIIK